MLAKSANLHARVDPKIKEDAERILGTLGIPVSRAVDIFYRQIVLRQGLPFDVKIPRIHPMDMRSWKRAFQILPQGGRSRHGRHLLISDGTMEYEISGGAIRAGRERSARDLSLYCLRTADAGQCRRTAASAGGQHLRTG